MATEWSEQRRNARKWHGSRGSFEAVRRRSLPNQEQMKVAGVWAWSWVPRRTQGWPEKEGFSEKGSEEDRLSGGKEKEDKK